MIISDQCRCCLSRGKKSECNIKHVCEEMLNGNICHNPKAIFGTAKISFRIRDLIDSIEKLQTKIPDTFSDGCIKKCSKCHSKLCMILG